MPRNYSTEEEKTSYSNSPRRYSIASNGISETSSRRRPHRAFKDLVFIDPKVAYLDRRSPSRSPSPRHRRRISTQNNQLVIRQKPRYRERVVSISPERNPHNQLVIRQRTRSESRGRSDEPYEVKKRIDNGEVVVRAKSRPGKRPIVSLVRKPKKELETGYDTEKEYAVRRKKSIVVRRRRSEEYDYSSDEFDRNSVEWDKARVVNLERKKVVEVDELEQSKDRRGSVYGGSRRGEKRSEKEYRDDVSMSSRSTRRGHDYSPDRSTARGSARRDPAPVLVSPVFDNVSRPGGRRRPVDFAGQETIPRGSVAGSNYAPSNAGRRQPVVAQPVAYQPLPVLQQPVPVTAQSVPHQGNQGFGHYLQQGTQYLQQGEGLVRTGEGLARMFN